MANGDWPAVAAEIVASGIALPTIYRAMKQADNGMPIVGSNSKELGVRVPPNPQRLAAIG
jgi:hypothetical protein